MATSDFKSSRGKRQTYICEICNASFQRYPCQMKMSSHAYCSQKCVGESKKHGSTIYCHMCDTPFYRRYGEQDVGVTINQFCSNECYQEWRTLNRKSTTYIKDGTRHMHRVVAEKYLGRLLTSDEVVHHVDLNRHNNSPSNLMVLPSQSVHMDAHFGRLSSDDIQRFSLVKTTVSGN